MNDWTNVIQILTDAACDPAGEKKTAVFPGAVLLVARGGEVLFHDAVGCRSVNPETTPLTRDMVFDVASLTKALITTTLVMMAIDRGQLAIDQRVSRVLQTFGTLGKDKIQIRHLLNHTSGFAPTAPYAKMLERAHSGERAGIIASRGAAEYIFNDLYRTKLESMPGQRTAYSDLGYIILGHVCENVGGGVRLDKMADRQIIQPLKLRSTGYVDLERIRRRGLEPVKDQIVPTSFCAWRERILCGEVHDDTAYAMGGIAGHAGIFSTALEVHAITSELLRCYRGEGTLVSQETIKRFWTRDELDPTSSWALGWDTPSAKGSSAGKYFSPSSVGHLAFTGCSMWIDPERELEVILLTNRVHLPGDNQAMKQFRPRLHDAVMETLGYGS